MLRFESHFVPGWFYFHRTHFDISAIFIRHFLFSGVIKRPLIFFYFMLALCLCVCVCVIAPVCIRIHILLSKLHIGVNTERALDE